SGSLFFLQSNVYQLAVNGFVAVSLTAAAAIAATALGRGGLPADAGRAPAAASGRSVTPVAAGVMLALPLIALCVQQSAIAGVVLALFGGGALAFLLFEALRCERVERERLFVALVLMLFSMLFWAFFEQAGSSIQEFTGRSAPQPTSLRLRRRRWFCCSSASASARSGAVPRPPTSAGWWERCGSCSA